MSDMVNLACEAMKANPDRTFSMTELVNHGAALNVQESTRQSEIFKAFQGGTVVDGCGRVGRGQYKFLADGEKPAAPRKKSAKPTPKPKKAEKPLPNNRDLALAVLSALGVDPRDLVRVETV